METSEQAKRLASLGYTRRRMISCLGGDMPSLPQYLKLRTDEDAFQAFRGFVERMIQRCQTDEDQLTRALIGAARLLIGDLAGADEVLDHLPVTRVKLDHGAGYCLVVPTQTLQTVLPLPPALRDAQLVAGSREQAALHSWLEQHRSNLVWDEMSGQYQFANTDS